jgi:decaprenylphospho-beta-D-erythro-pentofuranosid-2-ulose 2-reductase
MLVGRDENALRAEAADLLVRHGRECRVFAWDLADKGERGDLHARRFAALAALGEIKGLFLASGVMPVEAEAEGDAALTRLNFDVNLTETVVVLNLFSGYLRARRAGFISVLSSVAGDRGRAGNKTYGASKAGLTAYLEGLRGALHDAGVLVQTVKPGPTRTPMTVDYKGPAALLAAPGTVARDIVRGLEKRRTTVYTPGRWRLIMGIIRALPEFLARKVPG